MRHEEFYNDFVFDEYEKAEPSEAFRTAGISIEIICLRLAQMINRHNGGTVSSAAFERFKAYVFMLQELGFISDLECKKLIARGERVIEEYELEAALLDVENKKASANIKPLSSFKQKRL